MGVSAWYTGRQMSGKLLHEWSKCYNPIPQVYVATLLFYKLRDGLRIQQPRMVNEWRLGPSRATGPPMTATHLSLSFLSSGSAQPKIVTGNGVRVRWDDAHEDGERIISGTLIKES